MPPSTAPFAPPRSRTRLLTTVLDCRGPVVLTPTGLASVPARTVLVSALLDCLSAAELVHMRRANREATLSGRPHYRCPACHEPVYPAVCSVAAAGVLGGARAHFKHHARPVGAADCPLARERGTSVEAVDALRFDGAQEGRWHAETKERLGELLVGERGVREVFVETALHDQSGAWRLPDLLVNYEAGVVALEVQGASPQLDVVLGREAFYQRADVGLLWIVDADRLEGLQRQGMQDIYWQHDGVLFGWSERAEAESRTAGHLHLHRLRVREPEGRLEVEDRLVAFAEAVAEVRARLAQGPWPLAEDALARAYRAALLAGDDEAQRVAYERLRAEVGLTATWEQACDDRVSAAVGGLVVALTGKKGVVSKFANDANPSAMLNNFLAAPSYRFWVPIVLATCEGHPRADALLARPSTTRLVENAWAACQADPERTRQLRQRWGAFLRRLVPPVRA